MNPDKLNKWNKWIGDVNTHGTIKYEFTEFSVLRLVNKGLNEMVGENINLQVHSAFYFSTHKSYIQSALMFIRRQVRTDKDSISLKKLVTEMLDNYQMFDLTFYTSLYTLNKSSEDEVSRAKEHASQDFQQKFQGDIPGLLDPNILVQHLQTLSNISEKCSSFIDRRLAHLDKREPSYIPELPEINDWCDSLNIVLRSCVDLLYAVDYIIEPKLSHNWKRIFKVPWIE